MKFHNLHISRSPAKPKWEMTDDGFLRCKARVLASRVMPYGRDELGELPPDFINDRVNMLVHPDDMAQPESLRSLEGAPIVAGEHNWLSPEVVREHGVGSVSGTPYIEGEYLICDLMITDPDAIRAVRAGELPEISAAYGAEANFTPGTHGDNSYDAMQQELRYNHIAILPEGHGRAGRDVRIFNKNKASKEGNMPEEFKPVQVRLKNTGKTIITNMEGADAMAAEEKVVNEAEATAETTSGSLETTMTELETKNAELETLQAECEELKGELSVYKEKLDTLMDGSVVEAAADEMIEEQGEASEILENASIVNEKGEAEEDPAKKEEMMNSMKKLHGAPLHSAVLSAIGIKVENMSPEAIAGAFKAQAQITNSMKGKKTTVAGATMVNGQMPLKVENKAQDTRSAHQRLGFPAPAKAE